MWSLIDYCLSESSIFKVYKSPVMRGILEKIRALSFENTTVFICGEKGTEKEYLVEIILEKNPGVEVLKLSEPLKEKNLLLKEKNLVYIIEKLDNVDLSLFNNPEIVFKCAIFLANNDLETLFAEGKIEPGLHEFLSKAHKFYIPPLRERKQDILPLANFFLKEIAEFLKIPTKELSKEAKNVILEHPWNGNAHQLKQCLAKACIMSRHIKLNSKDLFGNYEDKLSIKSFLEQKLGSLLKDFENIKNSNLYDTVIQEVEKALFILALNETGGNQLRASKILGINRNTLNKKLKHYNLI